MRPGWSKGESKPIFSADPNQYYSLLLTGLRNSARSTNAVERRRALRSLAESDEPTLYSLLSDTNPDVRAEASNVVQEVELRQGARSSYGRRFFGSITNLLPSASGVRFR